MPKPHGAASPGLFQGQADLAQDAQVIAFDDVAQRRERLLAYADATRAVIIYRFAIPPGARVAALGTGVPRDARAQLDLIVGLTGGAVAMSPDGLAARIPKTLAAGFEALARPLLAAYLVALDLGEPVTAPVRARTSA